MSRRPLAVAIALLVAAGVLPACSLVGGGGHYNVDAIFPRAVSVFPSSDVRVLGLPAGEVTDVEVEGDVVRIRMRIPDDIQIPDDARAQIVPQSLIGERYIQLSPAFHEGMTPMEDGAVISGNDDQGNPRIVVPVEPDEALAALKELLDSLDPDGLGTLVHNLDESLKGNGAALNDALGSLSQVVSTFAENDDTLVRITESFDRLTTTLATREQQLGEVLDAFADASQVLADEREDIKALVAGLADLSESGLRLVGEHAGDLRTDIQTLADAAATIDANLGSVTHLLEGGAQLSTGLLGAYNPGLRALNLRNSFGPLVFDIVNALLEIDICLPVLVDCEEGQGASAPTPASIDEPAPSVVGSLLTLLAAPTVVDESGDGAAARAKAAAADAVSTLLGVEG